MDKIPNLVMSFLLSVFIISGSVILGVSYKELYYNDIKKLNLSEVSGFTEEEIKLNYDYLIDYNLSKDVEEFDLPTIDYSKQGKIHFEEVRDIFQIFKLIFYVTGILSIISTIINIKNKNIKFLDTTSKINILLPVITAIPLIINFNYFFVKFHEIVFSNDYWIFNPIIDPVIKMLPEEIFFNIGIFILSIILIVSIILQIVYRILHKAYK